MTELDIELSTRSAIWRRTKNEAKKLADALVVAR